MYIIARDGSGDFTSIQAAVDAVPFGNRAPVILLVRMDEYHRLCHTMRTLFVLNKPL